MFKKKKKEINYNSYNSINKKKLVYENVVIFIIYLNKNKTKKKPKKQKKKKKI